MNDQLLKSSRTTDDNVSAKSFRSYTRIAFQAYLWSNIITYDKYPCILVVFKLLLGFLIIGLPSITIFFLVYIFTPVYTKYIIFPYILSISLFIAGIILLLIIRLKENCQQKIMFTSWERIGFTRLFSSIVFFSFLLSALMKFEQFFLIFPILRGNISQMQIKEPFTREINQGSFIFRLVFIAFFWDVTQEKLGYFDLTVDFQKEFRSNLQYFIIPMLIIAFYICCKMLLFKTKNLIAKLSFCLIVIYEAFYFLFYPIGDKVKVSDNFFYNNSKFFELIPLLFFVIGLVWIAIKGHILALLKNKLYSYYNRKSDKITIAVVIVSFIIILLGLGGISYTLFVLLICYDIEPLLEYSVFQEFSLVFAMGLLLYLVGNSFTFGHFAFGLIYKPVAYQFCNHVRKTHYYIKCSNNMINTQKKNKKRKMKNVLMN